MLYDTLIERLREFFVDLDEQNLVFSLGDLFDPSQFRLRDVYLRTELINALNLPFELKGVFIGDFKVEGFVGFVTGSPLTITVDNVCLVMGHKPVEWSSELVLRYAKELLIAVMQSLAPTASDSRKNKSDIHSAGPPNESINVSPAKWILSKIQATLAETSVRLERLHVRFESEYEGQLVAYGVHIPMAQLSPRETDEQILNRRQQPGVKYPRASTDTASKRLYLSNISVYCDLHATSFVGDTPQTRVSSSTPRGIHSSAPPPPPPPQTLSTSERMKRLRESCQQPFSPSAARDLVLISALWLKLDFVRTPSSSWGLGAVDVVTEAITIDGDVAQLTVLQAELARLRDFFARSQRLAQRPCSVDRERHAPPQISVSITSLLPVVTEEQVAVIHAAPQSRAFSTWLRGMWRYAARCVLLARRSTTAAKQRVKLGAVATHADPATATRYIALYKRSLSDEAIRIVLFGKALLPSSPRATDARRKLQSAAAVPVYERLSRVEHWELSDLVLHLPVHDQRVLRHQANQQIRDEFASYQLLASPRGSGLTISIPEATSTLDRRASGASISPKSSSKRSSPTHALHPLTPPTLVDGSTELPDDFVANHHAHFRARAESSPSKLDRRSLPSPTAHPPLLHAASAPLSRQKAAVKASSPNRFSKPTSPSSKQRVFVETLLPSWVLQPSRTIPLLNWHIGPLTVRLHRCLAPSTPQEETEPKVFIPPPPSSTKIPARASTADLEVTVDGCTGCVLLCRSPSVSFLFELRVGLVKAVLVASSCGSHANAIATEYIRDAADGFLYLGLKYNFNHATPAVVSMLSPQNTEPTWDVKGKLCVGPVRIHYDDLALQQANQPDARSIRLDSASYLTIVQDVLANWKAVVQRGQPVAKQMHAVVTHTEPSQQLQKQQRRATRERVGVLLDALMHQSSCVEVALSGMELELALLTRHIVDRVVPLAGKADPAILPVFESEQVQISLPATTAGLQNRPIMNDCSVHAGGAKVKFTTTKHGRAAVIDHVLKKLFPSS